MKTPKRGRPFRTGPVELCSSQAQASGLTGIPADYFRYLKEMGAGGFRSGRVNLRQIWDWLNHPDARRVARIYFGDDGFVYVRLRIGLYLGEIG